MSNRRIREWYDYWGGEVYVAFSGGKDSTVLLHLVRSLYPDVPAVFCNTGLEFPEIVQFVRAAPNVTWLKPKMSFREVLQKYGYPVVSKNTARGIKQVRRAKSYSAVVHLRMTGYTSAGHYAPRWKLSKKWHFLLNAPFPISDVCCDVMKKRPSWAYEKETGQRVYLGTMASDSNQRRQAYHKEGCNAFKLKRPHSAPMAFWLEDDVWAYIRSRNIPYCPVYDQGYDRTGCVFCMFGVHMEKPPNRFLRLEKTHPALHRYCMEKLGCRRVLEYIGVPWTAKGD